MNAEYTQRFYEEHCRQVLEFLRRNSTEAQVLRLSEVLAEPPMFFVSVKSAIWRFTLSEETQEILAWLILKFVAHPTLLASSSKALLVAKDSYMMTLLRESSRAAAREIAAEIDSHLPDGETATPKEKHEKEKGNESVKDDWRKIPIYPALDEFNKKPHLPVMRPSTLTEDEPDAEERYLEAQFRMYRENVVGQFRSMVKGGRLHSGLGFVNPNAFPVELEDIVFPGSEQHDDHADAASDASSRSGTPPPLARPVGLGWGSPAHTKNRCGDGRAWALSFRCLQDLWWFTVPLTPPPAGGAQFPPPLREQQAESIWWPDGIPFFLVEEEEEEEEEPTPKSTDTAEEVMSTKEREEVKDVAVEGEAGNDKDGTEIKIAEEHEEPIDVGTDSDANDKENTKEEEETSKSVQEVKGEEVKDRAMNDEAGNNGDAGAEMNIAKEDDAPRDVGVDTTIEKEKEPETVDEAKESKGAEVNETKGSSKDEEKEVETEQPQEQEGPSSKPSPPDPKRKVIALCTYVRDTKRLAQNLPAVVVQIHGSESDFSESIRRISQAKKLRLELGALGASIAPFNDVMRKLQIMKSVPFKEELLFWKTPLPDAEGKMSTALRRPGVVPEAFLRIMKANSDANIVTLLGLTAAMPYVLNTEQNAALVGALTEKVSLIQGSASTGKASLIALIVKIFSLHTQDRRILLLCKTQTELAYLIKQILALFVPRWWIMSFHPGPISQPIDSSMVFSHQRTRSGKKEEVEETLQGLVDISSELEKNLREAFQKYHPDHGDASELLAYIAEHDSEVKFCDAFRIPSDLPEHVDQGYLFERWKNGDDAGVLCSAESVKEAAEIWATPLEERGQTIRRWKRAVLTTRQPSTNDLEDSIARLYDLGHQYNTSQSIISLREQDDDFHLIREKKIILGTMGDLYEIREVLSDAELPEVVIVSNADEILESELVTAFGPKTDHLIMFGPVPMIRPIISNQTLRSSSSSRKGYNMDISLFERLIQKGYPCHSLNTIYSPPPPAQAPPPPLQAPPSPPSPLQSQVDAPLRRRSSWGWGSMSPIPSRPTSPVTSPSKIPIDIPRVLQRKVGVSEQEWNRRKAAGAPGNPHMDAIMNMIGIEGIKEKVLDIFDTIELMKRQKRPLSGVTFNAVLMGNPAVGMYTFADHYFKLLESLGAIEGDGRPKRYININVAQAENYMVYVRRITRTGGGILVMDAHKAGKTTWSTWLTSPSVDGVSAESLAAQLAKGAGKQVYLFAGPQTKMDSWLTANPTLNDAIPYGFYFSEFEVDELLQLFEERILELFKGEMKVEGGFDGPFVRFAIESLQRKMGDEGSANELTYFVDDILVRQARRLAKTQGGTGEAEAEQDCMLITKEDLLVQAPKTPVEESKAYKDLSAMIGLDVVKSTVNSLIRLVRMNTQRQLHTKKPVQISLNRVFLGPPGTGKSTVAEIYAKLLNLMGLLSTGEVVQRNASDFIGQYIGQSEVNTRNILASAKGKVLIIDEAHSLNPTDSNGVDSYKEDVINTLVAGITNAPGDDQCVLLLGYEDEMLQMFENANPGLDRRFRISDAFYFPNFTLEELMLIFDKQLKDEDLAATPTARKVASEILDRARRRPNFGNGGAVENVIAKAKENYYGRFEIENLPDDIVFEPYDFDPDYARGGPGTARLDALFEDLVGRDEIKEMFSEYRIVSRTMKACGKDATKVIPMNFIFKGPPGTGKTTIARKMGHIYYDMGFLASTDVIECSATDLIGSYLGQTGPKTQAIFKKALGKVLFIDEAYRLGHGEYAQEAIGELVTLMTMKRFPEEIVFKDLEPEACLEILDRELHRNGVNLKCLADKGRDYKKMVNIVKRMSGTPAWGNARDMMSLSVHLIREAHKTDKPDREEGEMFELLPKAAVKHLMAMQEEQKQRAAVYGPQPGTTGRNSEKFDPSVVLEQLTMAKWRAVRQQLSSRMQLYNTIPLPP